MFLKLLVLSNSKKDPDEPVYVTQFLEHGLDVFHLRKPDFSSREMDEYINQIPARFWGNIVIHSHYHLVKKYNLLGIHLGKTKRRSWFFKKFRLPYMRLTNPKLQVTTSFHHLASLYEETYPFDYVFLSPIFDSISKSGYQSGFSHHNIASAINRSHFKIMALGGIEIDKLEFVKNSHFAGVVLSGVLWQNENKIGIYNEIRHKIIELNKDLEIV